jgi:ribosome-associated protein
MLLFAAMTRSAAHHVDALRRVPGTRYLSFSSPCKTAILSMLRFPSGITSRFGDAMLRISRDLTIDDNDIDISFVRASGPGGQNVNKLSTAAQLRFDTRRIALPPDAEVRLTRLAGQRMTKDGVIVIHAQRFRTQERNRADAIDRLVELLREAMTRPIPRRPTKPTLGSKKRRLEGKKRRSDVKARRGSGGFDD